MFTGIVQGIGIVTQIVARQNARSLIIQLPDHLCNNVAIGASVAINGTCLTVTQQQGHFLHFDVIAQTLNLTNLGKLDKGSKVNVERSAKVGDEIGGHVVSGHVTNTVTLVEKITTADNTELWFETPKALQKYIFPQGFASLNGCSLTIAKVEASRFCVCLIPETLRTTVFGMLPVGDAINLEIDNQTQVIVTTVERILAQQHSHS